MCVYAMVVGALRVCFDRDVNGARNVLLRYLTLHVSGAVEDGRTAVGSKVTLPPFLSNSE